VSIESGTQKRVSVPFASADAAEPKMHNAASKAETDAT
jgi:hypothetical protein